MLAEQIGADDFTIPEDLSKLISGTSTPGEILEESERKLFVSRKNALLGMKSQLASRKDQLTDETKGLTVQLTAIEDALKLIGEELTGLDKLYGKGLVSMQRLTEAEA